MITLDEVLADPPSSRTTHILLARSRVAQTIWIQSREEQRRQEAIVHDI